MYHFIKKCMWCGTIIEQCRCADPNKTIIESICNSCNDNVLHEKIENDTRKTKIVKQVLVVRNDLNMRKGKIAAQCCHASLAVFTQMMKSDYIQHTENGKIVPLSKEFPSDFIYRNAYQYTLRLPEGELGEEINEWLSTKFTKICVRVDSEQELHEVYNKAKVAGLPCSLIQDAGDTEFHGVPTFTCCAIGPAKAEKIDVITGNLKLL